MLIKHLRDGRNCPFGTIVAISPTDIGLAICSPRDRFSKKMGVKIAKGRAQTHSWTRVPNRKLIEELDETVLDVVNTELYIMIERSKKYFKDVKNITN